MSVEREGQMLATVEPAPAGPDQPPTPLEVIRLENVTKTYRIGDISIPVVRGVSLSIHQGEMVTLMGASGSGKTTLMNILGCLDRPTSGKYWLDGKEMSRLSPDQRALMRTTKLGFVFQSFNLLPRTSALANVLMPLEYALHPPSRGDSRENALELLERVGLAERLDHEPSQMSGGQQQRVAIARSLINRPVVLLADEPTGNLDSRTGDAILRMFQRLNAQGITVIIVTHDPKVAGYAHRTIRIADGVIESDSRTPDGLVDLTDSVDSPLDSTVEPIRRIDGPAERGSLVAADAAPAVANRHAKPRRPRMQLAFPSTLRSAVNNLRRNVMRSTLTAIGVVIGVAAVIAMTEIGEGSKRAIEKTIASMGAYKLPIFPQAASTGGVSQGAGTVQSLKPEDVEEIERQCPAVRVVAPLVWSRAQLVYQGRNWVPQQISGATPDYLEVREWEVVEGDCFTNDDVKTANNVCLIGQTIKNELFEDESPVGKTIRIKGVPFRVVGLLSGKGANMMGQDQDDVLIAPWTTIKYKVNSNGAGSSQSTSAPSLTTSINTLSNLYPTAEGLYPVESAAQAADLPQSARMSSIDMIMAKAAGAKQVPEAIDELEGLLRERHHLGEDRDDDFKILNLTEIADTIASASAMMGTLLLVVASISLVVGGVGIMNIMLVSVTERTREIGLRMAVGARRHHILQQFLTEAVLLCLVGGALGVLLGRGASIAVRYFEQWPTQASLSAIVASVAVSAGVGIVFGFYPAWKASRLDPIEALRHE